MTYKTALLSTAVAFSLATQAIAQDASTVVATVGDTDITLGEMIIARAQLPQQYAQFPDEVIFQGVMDQLIQQQLLADSLGETPARVEYAISNELRGLRAGEVVNDIADEAVTDDAIADAYEAMTANTNAVDEFNASHLLVSTEEEALAAQARINDGEDFAEVAKELSTGPTGPNGGNLGWFSSGMMVPEFENAVAEMEVDDVSNPVQTQFGWHVITLNEKRVKEAPTLEEVSADLAAQLQEEAITARIEELRADAEITLPEEGTIDPALLNNLNLLEP